MERWEVMEAMEQLSPADRASIRAALIRNDGFQDAPGVGSAMAACIAILEEVRTGADPVKVCQAMLDEMAGMCCD